MTTTYTPQQHDNLRRSLIMGHMLDIVRMRGGTGELRKPLSNKEYRRCKKRMHTVKASRKANW